MFKSLLLAALALQTPPTDATPLPGLEGTSAADQAPPQRAAPQPGAPIPLRPNRDPKPAATSGEAASPTAPAPRVDPAAPMTVRVAFGLGPEAPGTAAELAMVEQLAETLAKTKRPAVVARRTPPGAAAARRVCREGQDDLVIEVGYLPDRADPVWMPYDCGLGEAMGLRAGDAAASPDWIGVLWGEHLARVAQGAEPRRRGPNRRVKAALIAGGATLGVAGAVTLILLNVLRPTTTVLKVRPE